MNNTIYNIQDRVSGTVHKVTKWLRNHPRVASAHGYGAGVEFYLKDQDVISVQAFIDEVKEETDIAFKVVDETLKIAMGLEDAEVIIRGLEQVL